EWAIHRQLELAFVLREVLRHCLACLRLAVGIALDDLAELQARQVVNPVHRAERQRRPAVLPGTTGMLGGIEHHEPAHRYDTPASEMVSGGEAGLAGADHDYVGLQVHWSPGAWPVPTSCPPPAGGPARSRPYEDGRGGASPLRRRPRAGCREGLPSDLPSRGFTREGEDGGTGPAPTRALRTHDSRPTTSYDSPMRDPLLTVEERAELVVDGIATRAELIDHENAGIMAARRWALGHRREVDRVLAEPFLRELHARMFG